WYFPSIGEYSTLCEQQGFTVNYAALFPRPTKLEGENGLANWLEMFAGDRFEELSSTNKIAIVERVESELRPYLYRNGHWWADYYRIRIIATKPE
nr:SAM-dependent methyltransferase [Pleurocapsa sp. MO_226.B13]